MTVSVKAPVLVVVQLSGGNDFMNTIIPYTNGIYYDSRYPARSVAVMRDTTQGKPYAVRVGDELGRIRVAEIRRGEVVITFDDFGVERQLVLPVRKRQEELR